MERSPQAANDGSTGELPRVLGAGEAIAIVVGTVIGSGIFLIPSEMMRDTGSSLLVYMAWIVGGLLSLFGAMTYAELSTMMPYAGGEYVYLRGAYGDTTAFLYTWTWFTVAKPGSIATIAVGLARTLEFFPVFSHLSDTVPGFPIPIYGSQVFAIAVAWLMTGLNYLGIKKAGDFQLAATVLKAVLIGLVAALCFWSPAGNWGHFATTLQHATGGWTGFMLAVIATLWAYDGWSDLSTVAGEVRRPERNLPLALIGGLLAVAALYMATNAAIQYMLPAQAIAGSDWPAVAALRVAAGNSGAGIVAAAMAVSILVALNGSTMSGARVPYAAAVDGLFPRRFGRVHPRFHSPSTALVAQGLLATVLLLFLSRFQQLFELTVFSEWLFYALAASTVFVYRRKRPDLARPYRVWGYPFVPGAFVVCAAAVLVSSFAGNLKGSLIGSAFILSGLPVMALLRRR